MASILILEDDVRFRETLADLLEHNLYEVALASSASEALERAKKQPFHLVLTDVRIQGDLDGVAALEAIQRTQPQIRSIIMTGYADRDVPLRAARLQADDYLFKPFRLKDLLQSVRAVLERESPFRSLFQRMAEVPAQAKQKALRWAYDSQLQKLNDLRQSCLKQFFLLLRSKHLAPNLAYRMFCLWESLELRYLDLPSPQHCSPLIQSFGEFEAQLLQPGALPVKSPSISQEKFLELLQKIQAGQVEWVHLLRAVQLLHDPQARRENLESHCTYHWLWSQPEVVTDPLLGLTVGRYKLASLRSQGNQQARLYEAIHSENPKRGDLILALPDLADSQALVEQEIQGNRAQLLNKSIGHSFLLYRGHSLSLQANLPAQGVSPLQAWKLLRPVFEEVELHHQQGRCSGHFSLQDVDCLPGRPCSLGQFSDLGYREQHRVLARGVGLVMNFASAPEVDEQPEPQPASDQAVLGRLLFEVIFGGGYPKPETRLHLRFLGNAQANDHFRPLIPRLEPLAAAFYRLCHSDPRKRFPSLRAAITAIDLALDSTTPFG